MVLIEAITGVTCGSNHINFVIFISLNQNQNRTLPFGSIQLHKAHFPVALQLRTTLSPNLTTWAVEVVVGMMENGLKIILQVYFNFKSPF